MRAILRKDIEGPYIYHRFDVEGSDLAPGEISLFDKIDWSIPYEFWQPDELFEGLNLGNAVNMFILTPQGIWGVNSLDFEFEA